MIAASGEQPARLGIIFKAQTGENLRAEAKEYDPRVFVRFQGNAWATRAVLVSMVPDFGIRLDSLLLMDGYGAHRGELQEELKRHAGTTCWFGPPKLTDTWQPVDRGNALSANLHRCR